MPETGLINNWLFAAMSDSDQDTLRPKLDRRVVAQGELLLRTGDWVDVIHFPVSAQIANVMTLDAGEGLAVSTVGREGVTGLVAFMAREPVGWDVVTHIGGTVWSLSADVLRAQADRSPELMALLLQATHDNQREAHGQAVCAAFHPVLSRLARWLLLLQERTGLSSFALTQENFAELLGVRRTTVVAAIKTLKSTGALVAGTRGRVVIQDRLALKALACACHARKQSLRASET